VPAAAAGKKAPAAAATAAASTLTPSQYERILPESWLFYAPFPNPALLSDFVLAMSQVLQSEITFYVVKNRSFSGIQVDSLVNGNTVMVVGRLPCDVQLDDGVDGEISVCVDTKALQSSLSTVRGYHSILFYMSPSDAKLAIARWDSQNTMSFDLLPTKHSDAEHKIMQRMSYRYELSLSAGTLRSFINVAEATANLHLRLQLMETPSGARLLVVTGTDADFMRTLPVSVAPPLDADGERSTSCIVADGSTRLETGAAGSARPELALMSYDAIKALRQLYCGTFSVKYLQDVTRRISQSSQLSLHVDSTHRTTDGSPLTIVCELDIKGVGPSYVAFVISEANGGDGDT
jgi:hypothetical protein